MRRNLTENGSGYRIAILDDEQGIIDSLSVIIRRLGYEYVGFTEPLTAVEEIRKGGFDLLVLDYLMKPIHGDEVIRQIRRFDPELYILLLTGHKDIAPPLETIKRLDIQGYCEKSDRLDQMVLLIESGIKVIEQMRTIRQYRDGLDILLDSTPEIYQLKPTLILAESVLILTQKLAGIQDAFILLEEGQQGICSGTGQFRHMNGIGAGIEDGRIFEKISKARFTSAVEIDERGGVFPFVCPKGDTKGVLYVDGEIPSFAGRLIELLLKQMTSAICNIRLHELVNEKNVELTGLYGTLEQMYLETVEALRLAVDAKDVYTRGHSDRVAEYAVLLGKQFNLPEEDLQLLKLSGVFHDVGKIGTADDILFKTDALELAEYEEIKRHPEKGAEILSAVTAFREVVPIVMNHHERQDGKGYPAGKAREDIPFLSAILSVADAFDAMTTNRLYRKKLSLEEAIQQLETAKGTQFDAQVVDAFIEMLGTPEFSLLDMN